MGSTGKMQGLTINSSPSKNANPSKKSVILFIGDGMGFPHVSLARAYNGVVNQNPNLYMDPLMIGSAGTKANPNETEHVSGLVTDSAAAATALGSGHRTYNGA